MANFEVAYQRVKLAEGGYQDHPNDSGNYNSLGQLVGTNWGINAKVYEAWMGWPPSKVDMQQMPRSTAKEIYKARYWDRIKGDFINSQPVADIIFDAVVNQGSRVIKWVQRIIGVVADGAVGPITLAAINKAVPSVLYNRFKQARKEDYIDLANRRKPKLKVFLQGWLNRLSKFQDFPATAAASGGIILLGLGLAYWAYKRA